MTDSDGGSGAESVLACGPGTWTPALLRRPSGVTAVDAAPEMLALARTRVGADHWGVGALITVDGG